MPVFYIEHTADVAHGGFSITTQAHCCKAMAGSSRFEFSLEPDVSVEFLVDEEVTYKVRSNTLAELFSEEGKQWLADGFVSADMQERARKTLFINEVRDVLSNLEYGRISEDSLHRLNIKSLEKVAEKTLLSRYLRDLDTEETDLQATRTLVATKTLALEQSAADIKALRMALQQEALLARAAF